MIKEDITQLKHMQQLLLEKNQLEKKILELPKDIAVKKELLARVQKSNASNHELVDAKKQELNVLHNQLEDIEREREHNEQQMESVQTQREYEALEKEIEDRVEQESKIRENQEVINNELSQLHEKIESEKELIDIQNRELESESLEVKKDTEELQQRVHSLNKEQASLGKMFDDEFVFKFQRIITTLDGEGLVPLQSKICGGCNMILPNHFANRVWRGDEILFCPYCSRVLYHGDEEVLTVSESYADADVVGMFGNANDTSEFELDDLLSEDVLEFTNYDEDGNEIEADESEDNQFNSDYGTGDVSDSVDSDDIDDDTSDMLSDKSDFEDDSVTDSSSIA